MPAGSAWSGRVLRELAVVAMLAACALGAGPLSVLASGQPPIATDQSESTREGSPLQVALDAFDPESDDLTFTVTSGPAHGVLDECSSGSCTYTPDTGPNYLGPDSFTWHANDGTSDSNVATFSIDVTENQAPVANDQSESTREAQTVAIFLDAFDPDFDALAFTIIDPPAHGTLDECSSGFCTYTPDTGPNYLGPDSFTWRANDGLADSNAATFSIDVTANQPPVAHDASRLLRSVEPTSVSLLAEDADGDLLEYMVLDPPDHGTLDDCSFGSCTYTPDGTFTTSDSFTWKVNDGLAESNTATLTIRLAAGPADLAAAMANDPSVVSGASYLAFPPEGAPNDVYASALSAFPTDGSSFAILTSGDASLAATPNSDEGSGADDGGPAVRGDTDFDVTILKIDLAVPIGVNCLRFDLAFYSEEFPEFVGSSFNDAFIAELDSSTWTTSGSEISAPDNFAFDPDGNVISINSTGVAAMSAGNAVGTTYDGATPLLQAGTPITAGPHSVYLSIFDQGDHALDSAAFVDNLRLLTLPMPETQCAEGVTPSNTPPSVEAGGPYLGDEGNFLISLDGTVIDPDPGDTLTTSWSYTPDPEVDPGASCAFGDATAVDTTVGCTDDGTYTLTLTANDGVNPPVSDTATLTLANVNPEIAINSPSEGATYTIGAPVALNATVADAGGNDHDFLTCSLDWGDGTVEPGVVADGFCTGSHPYAAAGPYTITATVEDDDLGSGGDSVGIIVSAEPNTPPSVEAGGPYLGDEGNFLISLDGTVIDPDPGDTLTTSWSYTPDPEVDPGASCAFGDATAVDTTVGCTDDGTYTLTLTANDGVNPPVSDTATLTLANVNPEIAINSPSEGATYTIGAPVALNATVADAGGNDHDFLTCSLDWGDGTVEPGVVADGFCTGSHPYAAAGPYTITATVEDDDLGSGGDSVGIIVSAEPNTPPSVEAGGPYLGDEGNFLISLDGTVIDPDPGDTLTTSWSYTPDPEVDPGASCAFGDATAVDTTVGCTDDGTYTLTLTANDGVNPPVSDTATLTLANVNPEIAINSPSEGATYTIGAPVALNATVADAGGNDHDFLTCSLDWGDGTVEPGVVADGFCTGSHPYAAAGPYTITATVEDDDLGSGGDSVGIIVSAEPNTDLSVAVTDTPDPVTGGNVIHYVVVVTNAGPQVATGVTLDVSLPQGSTLVAVDNLGCASDGESVTCDLGTLASGSSFDVILDVGSATVDANTVLTLTATVGSVVADSNPVDNSVSEQTQVVPASDEPDTASGWIPEAGGNVKTGTGKPSKRDPMTTEVAVPPGFPGLVSITEGPITQCADGYVCFGQEADITAPTTSATTPLRLTFLIHPSALPPSTQLHEVVMFHDDQLVARCTGEPGIADPDPCIDTVDRHKGSLRIIVYSSENGRWRGGS